MFEFFNWVDYAVILGYVAGLVGLGLYLQRKASASLEDYIVGGRKLPWWAVGMSGMASWLDMAGTAIIIAFLFLLGPRGLFVEFRGGACLIMPFMLLWAGKWHRRSGVLTGAEWMVFRFGNGLGGRFARIAAVVATVFGSVGMLAMLVFGAGQFMSVFLPLGPNTCSAVLLILATGYTIISGFYGVVFTDVFQGGFIILATIYVAVTAFLLNSSAEEIAVLAERVTGNPDWTTSYLPWHTPMPEGHKPYEYLALFASFYLLRNVFGGMSAGGDPKYFGAKNDRECGMLSFLWTLLLSVRWPLMIGIAIIGLNLVGELFPSPDASREAVAEIRAVYPDVEEQDWDELLSRIANAPESQPAELIASLDETLGEERRSEKLQLLGYSGPVNPEKILPAVLLIEIPAGLRGLLVVALLAAFMSTFDSHLNAATGIVVRDMYQAYLRPKAGSRELIRASWAVGILLVLMSVAVSFTVKNLNDIWGWIVMGLTSGLMAPAVLRLYWSRFNGGGFAIGTLFGLVAAVGQRLYSPIYERQTGEPMHELVVFCLVMCAGIAGSIIGTYATPRTDEDVLWKFYDKTRPFGFWGRMKRRLAPEQLAITSAEHRNDLLALPFAMVFQVALFMVPMLVLIHSFTSAAVWAAICLAGLGGMYVFWYRQLPEANWYEPPAADEQDR